MDGRSYAASRKLVLTATASLALFACGVLAEGAAAAGRVAVLDVSSPTSGSQEQTLATQSGFTADVLSSSQWLAKSAADFKTYEALILPERSCTSAYSTLWQSREAWVPAITGNQLLIGTDPSDHAAQGGEALERNGIAFAAADTGTGLYMAFECESALANMTSLLDAVNRADGSFEVEQAGCYNRIHRVADHPAFANTTDSSLSNWSCSVHDIFTRFPDTNYRVLAIAEGLGTFTAPDGSIGQPYILASGDLVTYAGRRLLAIGDSVSAGEGIGYGYEWNSNSKRWDDKNGSSAFFDTTYQPVGCHQDERAHPRVLADLIGATLIDHLSCTGATFDEGLAGVQDTGGVSTPQIGGFPGRPAINPRYRDSDPDLVTVSIGANDIEFASVVSSCFYPLLTPIAGGCDGNLDRAEDRLDGTYVSARFDQLHDRIQQIGSERGKRPLVFQTEYVNPFPTPSQSQDCFDVKGGWTSGFSRDEINRMISGLRTLNDRIEQVALKDDGVIAVPASREYEDHRFCSNDPWVFGMDTAVDFRTGLTYADLKTSAPFHPTIAGQAATARQIKSIMASAVSMRRSGALVEVPYASGVKLTFAQVNTVGTTIVIPTNGPQLPTHPSFAVRSGYQIDTAANFSGNVQVRLPAQSGDKMWHYQGGQWQDVQATYNGGFLQGSVTSLSPFAVGPAVAPVKAVLTGGDAGVAPEAVTFTASNGLGSTAEVRWDFGDGETGTGEQTTHSYPFSGTYEVRATVRSPEGGEDQTTTTVTISNPGPVLNATVPASGQVGDQITLDSSASTDPNGQVARGWWEIDGKILEPAAQKTTLMLEKAGALTVEGVVLDDELKETRQSFTIHVSDPVGPPGRNPTTPPPAFRNPTTPPPAIKPAAADVLLKALRFDRRSRRMRANLQCRSRSGSCRGRVVLTLGKAKVRARYSIAHGKVTTIRFKLSRKVLRKLRAKSQRFKLEAVTSSGAHVKRTFLVEAPRKVRRK